MKINSIRLSNIGPHKDTEIEFTEPITAIVGENGSGKSFLIEAVVACLYGSFPSRPGSIYDRITQGFDGEAQIDVEFEMSGETYQAKRRLRRIGKTTSATANLIKLIDLPAEEEIEAVTTNRMIAGPKITDFENAVVNLFGSQDLFMASVFSSQANSGDICSARPGERKAVFAQLLGLGRFDQISGLAKERGRAVESDIEVREEAIKALKQRASGVTQAQSDLKAALLALDTERANLEAQRLIVAGLEVKAKDEAVALERWRQLDGQVKKLDDEIRRMEVDLDGDRAEYRRLKEIVDRAPEIEKVEADLPEARAEKDRVLEAIRTVERANGDLREAKLYANRIEAELKICLDHASPIDKIPNEECCEGCVLVAGAWKAKERVPGLEAKLKEAQEQVDKLDRLVTRDPSAALEAKLEKIDGIIKHHEIILADAPRFRDAQGRLAAMTTAGQAKAQAISDKKAEREKISQETSEALALCPKESLGSTLENAKREQEAFEEKLSRVIGSVGALKERISAMEAAGREADDIEVALAGSRQSATDYRAIEQAFGRSGIQPLIIEQSRPELEAIAGELLGAATGGRMQVRFETQKELKSGDTVESLDIIITMDGQERKIEELSGGEQKMIRTAVRLTLAVFQARRGGSRLRTLFLDEVFDSLDSANSERVLSLLQSLQSQFDRIIIISHSDELLEGITSRVEIKNGRIGG